MPKTEIHPSTIVTLSLRAGKGGACKDMGQIRNMFSFGRRVKLKNAICALLISYVA